MWPVHSINFLSGFASAGCYHYKVTMLLDRELLRRYAEADSEGAFAELVRRHLDLVYSAALRQVNGDAHMAQDVAQMVFTDLARKAATLWQRQFLTGWLYTSTHFVAANAVRKERRRRTHEQEALPMHELLQAPTPDLDWQQLRPVLDKVMHDLKDTSGGDEQLLKLVFATHEVLIRGHHLRRIETTIQRMELSFIATLPSSQRSLTAEGQPIVLEIVVTVVPIPGVGGFR